MDCRRFVSVVLLCVFGMVYVLFASANVLFRILYVCNTDKTSWSVDVLSVLFCCASLEWFTFCLLMLTFCCVNFTFVTLTKRHKVSTFCTCCCVVCRILLLTFCRKFSTFCIIGENVSISVRFVNTRSCPRQL
jgi:hypothetical protein